MWGGIKRVIDIIRDGSLERLVIAVLVFGGLVFILATQGQVDERLFDVAFVIVGFYFGTTVMKIRSNGS